MRRQSLGEGHPVTLISLTNFAANLDAQGKHELAQPQLETALRICLRVLPAGHPDTAAAYTNLRTTSMPSRNTIWPTRTS